MQEFLDRFFIVEEYYLDSIIFNRIEVTLSLIDKEI